MNEISKGGASSRPSRAQLAALIVAGGLLSSTPVSAGTTVSHGLWLKDRSSLIAFKSKDSTCGKCGANACGESYQDKKRKKQKTGSRHMSQRLRTQGKNASGGASKPSNH